jgi:hypothetical protein
MYNMSTVDLTANISKEKLLYTCNCNTINVEQSGLGVMVFNSTFNIISVISCWSVLLEEETGGPGENHWSVASTPRPDQDSNSQHQ